MASIRSVEVSGLSSIPSLASGDTADTSDEHEPEDGPSEVISDTGYTAGAALKTRSFWLLSAVWLFQHVGTSAVFIHIVPFLDIKTTTGNSYFGGRG